MEIRYTISNTPILGDMEVYNGILELNDKNYLDALNLFEKGADYDNENALLLAGVFYFAGFGLEKREPTKAMELFKRAVLKFKNPVAQYLIGTTHFYGDVGVKQDKDTGFQEILSAAENHWPYAIANMGLIYTYDSYIEPASLEKAFFWHNKLARKDNNRKARLLEGTRYLFGNKEFEVDLSHVNRNNLEAAEDFMVNLNHLEAIAPILCLGGTYKDTVPNFEDFQYILIWMLLSETNLTGIYTSQVGLLGAYAKAHKEDPENIERAHYYGAFASRHINESPSVFLGKVYKDSAVVERDHKEAAKWFKQACDDDNQQEQDGEAFYLLGDIYQKGWDGVPQDYKVAYSCFKSAFDMGLACGATRISGLYCKGFGVEKSKVKTIEWLYKAEGKGCPTAKSLLASVNKKGYNSTRCFIKDLNKPY